MSDVPLARPTRFRTGGLSQRKPTRFIWTPDAEARARLAEELGLLALHRLEVSGQIDPTGRDEFRLQATLLAIVDQACIVTLVPVRTEISETILRRYLAGLTPPEAEETEMPADDSPEPLPETLDITEVATEAMMLALPLYPRAPGAEFGAQAHVPPGSEPIVEAKTSAFAGLAGLSERLKSERNGGGPDQE